ncbi:MAG: hypothetical protein LBT50_06820, partial [Prevotellaceae bacterium]|nr:hypothetical protein [Prevotellaceae bacterium]
RLKINCVRHCERSEAIQKEGGGRYPSRNHYRQYEPVRNFGLLHFVRNDERHRAKQLPNSLRNDGQVRIS